MEHFSSQKRLLILLSVMVVLLLTAGYFYVLFPSLQQIDGLRAEVREHTTFLTNAKELKQKETDTNGIEHHSVPKTPSTDQMLLDLYHAQKNSKSTIREITVNNKKDTTQQKSNGETNSLEDLQPLRFTVFVQSPDYSSIYTFINTIEDTDRVYVIEEVNLPGRENNSKVPFEYQVEITTFYERTDASESD